MTINSQFIHPRKRTDQFGVALSSSCYPPLSSVLDRTLPFKKLRIAIVTEDIVGPVKNGGIGTAYYYAARALAIAGHDVTILYSGRTCVSQTLEYWVEDYKVKGITFVSIPDAEIPISSGPSGQVMSLNYHVLEYLKLREDDFDVIHASEWRANIYLCLIAKKTGLYFQNTRFVVKASSPTLWGRIGNAEPIVESSVLFDMFKERKSIELADYVVGGSRYLLNWMEDQGYQIPTDVTFVQPNIFPTEDVKQYKSSVVSVTELVFFGRLEPRKGIHVFVDALLNLKNRGYFDNTAIPEITFLGKFRRGFDVFPLVQKIENSLRIKVNILDEMAQPEALTYLSGKSGRVAVIPSLMDNSPFTIYECLSQLIPFLSSNAGGGHELIEKSFHDKVLFEPVPVSLSNILEDTISNGCPIAKPSFNFKENIEQWMQWHLWLADQKSDPRKELNDNSNPLVSVCIAHHNRGQLLNNALESVFKQDYENIEVLVVDDGSTDPQSVDILNNIEGEEYRFPVTIIRQENRYLGAVRNTACQHAKGEYVLFMDDDNEAKPEEVSTFVEVANRTGDDVLTCFSDSFHTDRPEEGNSDTKRIVYHGENLAFGLLGNPYGDSNFFIKRSVFEALGGFTEHYKVGKDDMEFLSRAILSGIKVTLVPEALFWYRINKTRMREGQYSIYSGLVRVSESYVQGLHPDLANIIRYAQSMGFMYGSMHRPAESRFYRGASNGLLSIVKERLKSRILRHPRLLPAAKAIYDRLPVKYRVRRF